MIEKHQRSRLAKFPKQGGVTMGDPEVVCAREVRGRLAARMSLALRESCACHGPMSVFLVCGNLAPSQPP